MFEYFGSKNRLASTYQPPKHDVIVEPFAGAAGYAVYWLKRRSDSRAILLDVDPLVVEVWHRLLDMDPVAVEQYPNPVRGERTQDSLHLMSAAGAFEWQAFRSHGSCKVPEWLARDFDRVKRRVAADLALIQGRVEIHQADYAESPDIEATWFIDPPYQKEGVHYGSGNDLDFEEIGRWSRLRQGQVIVCEAAGADWLPFEPHRINQTVTNANSIEVVWYSEPELTLLTLLEEP